jgi:ferric-dicitrate binding protein FerR (iron transport regulator)
VDFHISDDFLDRFVGGECTPEEALRIECWLEQDPARQRRVNRLRAARRVAPRPPLHPDVDAARRGLTERIAAGSAAAWRGVAPRPRRTMTTARTARPAAPWRRIALRAAAIPAIPAAGGAAWQLVRRAGTADVHTATASTTDLGTRFSVRGQGTDITAPVVVADGSIERRARQVPPDRHGGVPTAGQSGQLTRSGDALVRPSVDVAEQLAWTNGRLVFHDTPLHDAVPQLERWCDLDVRVADRTPVGRRLTASFRDAPVSEILQVLAVSLDAEYQWRGRVVTLRARR